MAIEFTWLEDGIGENLTRLSHRSFLDIDSALRTLENKTGLIIDPYGRTRISPDHAQVLLDLLVGYDSETARDIQDIAQMLRISSEAKRWILVIGD